MYLTVLYSKNLTWELGKLDENINNSAPSCLHFLHLTLHTGILKTPHTLLNQFFFFFFLAFSLPQSELTLSGWHHSLLTNFCQVSMEKLSNSQGLFWLPNPSYPYLPWSPFPILFSRLVLITNVHMFTRFIKWSVYWLFISGLFPPTRLWVLWEEELLVVMPVSFAPRTVPAME